MNNSTPDIKQSDSESIRRKADANLSSLLQLRDVLTETSNRIYGEIPIETGIKAASNLEIAPTGFVDIMLFKLTATANAINDCFNALDRINKFI